MSIKQEQFRPSLSLAEVVAICDSLSQTEPGSKLYQKMIIYHAKINIGLNPPSYTSTVKQSVEQKLGLAPTEPKVSAAQYQARLQQKQELAPATLSKEDRFNLLAAKSFESPESLSAEEAAEGRALEQELYGMDMGTFPATEE